MKSLLRFAFIILLILVVVGGGLFLFQRGSLGALRRKPAPSPLNVNLQEIKPAAWAPFTKELLRVNIDNDPIEQGKQEEEQKEWLLFYRYDQGPLGGVIYDAQSSPRGDNAVPIPDQPSAYLVPYYLLPDYQENKANGYLGDEALEYREIISNPEADNAPKDRLIVLGKSDGRVNRLSIFWWINQERGYGGAHASTPGWFSLSSDKPNDWEAWTAGKETNAPNITTAWAWEPQADRSNLCRRVTWELTGGPPPNDNPRFVASDTIDLVFCSGFPPPPDPAYPEGQVVAYLLDGNRQRLNNPEDPAIPVYEGATVHKITYPGSVDQAILNSANPGAPIQVGVDTQFTFGNDGVAHDYTWFVTMIPRKTIRESVRWRITSVVAR